jgi:hypothetical protein
MQAEAQYKFVHSLYFVRNECSRYNGALFQSGQEKGSLGETNSRQVCFKVLLIILVGVILLFVILVKNVPFGMCIDRCLAA